MEGPALQFKVSASIFHLIAVLGAWPVWQFGPFNKRCYPATKGRDLFKPCPPMFYYNIVVTRPGRTGHNEKGVGMVTNMEKAMSEKDREFAQAYARLVMKRIEKDEPGRAEKRMLAMLREVGRSLGQLMREARGEGK